MAPRRSSRALAAQPSNSSQQMTHSSSSSATSGRAERHTRSRTKTSSPQKPATPRSRPFEGAATATQARGDRLPSQRPKRKRGSTDDDLGSDPVKDTDNEAAGADEDRDEDEDEDEETTRCVCGLQDYPGPPFPVALRPEPVTDEDHLGQSSKSTADAGTEEPGSLFIQCDICQVWQHGGCVGIMHVDMSPDEYFCELCRGDLHNLVAESKGRRRYSRYLPVVGPPSLKHSPAMSASKHVDQKRSQTKPNASTTTPQSGKRRSTMNSRDAAYDEEDMVRRVIEESKAEKPSSRNGLSERSGKRGRSGSHDLQIETRKRQRTDSHSVASASPAIAWPPEAAAESGDEHRSTRTAPVKPPRRARGVAAQNQREKEMREQAVEKERERSQAAGRRNGRAERRSAADSEPPDERAVSRPGTSMTPPTSTPRPMDAPPPPRSSKHTPSHPPASNPAGPQRKGERTQARRGRVGRNQYTRDRDLARDAANGDRDLSATARSQSRDGPVKDDNGSAVNTAAVTAGPNGEAGRSNRTRHPNPQRTTMNDMKRRVAAILDFISRIQVEMAGEQTPLTAVSAAVLTSSTMVTTAKNLLGDLQKMTLANDAGSSSGSSNHTATMAAGTAVAAADMHGDPKAQSTFEKEFDQLTSLEMMDVLTRKLVLWQKEYGKWGDK